MHRELRETEVDGRERHLCSRQIAERAAAAAVGAVGEDLIRDVCAAADILEHCAGKPIGAVVLGGIVFEHDAFVEIWAVARV